VCCVFQAAAASSAAAPVRTKPQVVESTSEAEQEETPAKTSSKKAKGRTKAKKPVTTVSKAAKVSLIGAEKSRYRILAY
jgi:hypothetical protein